MGSIRVKTVSASNRVKRGGSWNNNAENCRVANRNNNSPGNSNNNIGFRVANTFSSESRNVYGCSGRAQNVQVFIRHVAFSHIEYQLKPEAGTVRFSSGKVFGFL